MPVPLRKEVRGFAHHFNGSSDTVTTSLNSIFTSSGKDTGITRLSMTLVKDLVVNDPQSAVRILFGLDEISKAVMVDGVNPSGRQELGNFMGFVQKISNPESRVKVVIGMVTVMHLLGRSTEDSVGVRSRILDASTSLLYKSLSLHSETDTSQLGSFVLPTLTYSLKNPEMILKIIEIYKKDLALEGNRMMIRREG
jgi:hypothetical protein